MIRAPAALAAGAIVIAIAAVLALQLHPYVGVPRPAVSYDSYYYVWRSQVLADEGVGPLDSLPAVVRANLDRPGFPVLGSLLSAAIGIDAFTFMIVVRAVGAIAIGSAAGAIATGLLRHPPWSTAVLIVAMGTSAAVTGTAIASLENLLADVPLMAAAAAVPLALYGRGSLASVALLVAAAGLLHWVFGALFLALIVVAAVVAWIVPAPAPTDPAVARRPRSAAVPLAAIAGLAVALVLLPSLPAALPPLTGSLGNVHRLGLYQIPVVLPLAIAGGLLAVRGTRALGRAALVILALWAASVPVGLLLSSILPEELKLFRIAAFALGIPALVGIGLVVLVRLASGRWRVVGGLVAVAGSAVVLTVAAAPQVGPYNDAAAAKLADRFQQARTAGAYLAAVAPARTVVFLVDSRPWMIDRVFRAGVPARSSTELHVYVGPERDLIAGRPFVDPARPGLSAIARTWWELTWADPPAVLRTHPVLIHVSAKEGAPSPSGTAIGEGLTLLRGPPPPPTVTEIGEVELSWPGAISWTVLVIVVLLAVGIGWSRVLVATDLVTTVAMAPAVGAAVVVLAGTVVARTGLPLGAWAGRATVLSCLATGVAVQAVRRRPQARHRARR